MKTKWMLLVALAPGAVTTAADPTWNDVFEKARREASAGRYQDAEQTYRMALALAKQEGLGVETLAMNLHDLGSVQLTLGSLVDAESSLKRALAAWARAPLDHGVRATTMSNLGIVYRLTGRLTQAEAMQRAVLVARTTALGPDHPAVARAQDNLAAVLFDLHRYREAIELLEKVDQRYRVSRPSDPVDHMIVKGKLAGAYYVEHDLGRANESVAAVLTMLESRPSARHPVVGETLLLGAGILLGQGQDKGVADLLRKALEILESAYPSGHPSLARALKTYAGLLRQNGDRRGAKRSDRRADAMLAEYARDTVPRHSVDYREFGKSAVR